MISLLNHFLNKHVTTLAWCKAQRDSVLNLYFTNQQYTTSNEKVHNVNA